MKNDERERQELADYLAERLPSEAIEQLEKVKTERVQSRWIEAWDVHTDAGRWWLLTSPTNVYNQKQFPSLEVAFSFHVGLTLRVMEQENRTATEEDFAWFPRAWRKWEHADEALHVADEAEAYQDIGLRCRECLLALIEEACDSFPIEASDIPKAGAFVDWTDLFGNSVAEGKSAERRRHYLKTVAKSAWQLANWLTHGANAALMDAELVYRATEHVLLVWTDAILRFNLVGPQPCPNCSSYRVGLWTERTEEGVLATHRVCRSCNWKSEPTHLPTAEPETEDRVPPDPGTCVIVEVPLRGPPPPRPSGNTD